MRASNTEPIVRLVVETSSARETARLAEEIGKKVTEAIQFAVKFPGWIVQERVVIPEEEFPVFDAQGELSFEQLKVNTNPFYVGGAPVGAVTRISRDAVINVSAGGGSVPTFVV